MSATLASFFAQATNTLAPTGTTADAAAPAAGSGGMGMFLMYPVIIALVYFLFMRPQSQAKKKQEAQIKSAKTGDRVVTTSGIHGVITNVKDSTVIVKVADNVKLEIEKTHLDKITRADAAEPDKGLTVTKS
jgi:preprotein translocase subunit YajC